MEETEDSGSSVFFHGCRDEAPVLMKEETAVSGLEHDYGERHGCAQAPHVWKKLERRNGIKFLKQIKTITGK